VEDNVDNMLTARVLLQDDYLVFEATDGKQGVEMAKKHVPDLILMDISLPVLDGISAFKQIRNYITTSNIPVIALTASALISDREQILAEDFDAFVSKPIDEEQFFITIKQILYD
jgi:CheY-like chemotaxis protein